LAQAASSHFASRSCSQKGSAGSPGSKMNCTAVMMYLLLMMPAAHSGKTATIRKKPAAHGRKTTTIRKKPAAHGRKTTTIRKEPAAHGRKTTTIQKEADRVHWSISPHWSGSCNDVCSNLGGTCSQKALDDLGLSSTNKHPDALKQAYEDAAGADLTCNSWNLRCSGGNCVNWGLPFIHKSHFNDRLCWGGDAAAPCDKVPVDGHHRRLCPCEKTQAPNNSAYDGEERKEQQQAPITTTTAGSSSSSKCSSKVS